ncbi:MAG: TniQ family protein [Allosphingosinicella sp.]
MRRPLEPFPDESLDGFVARVAAHNHLENALAISAQGGVLYGHRPHLTTQSWEGLPTVAKCLKVDVAELHRRSYPLAAGSKELREFFGTAIDRRHLDTRIRRFSPAALQLSPHHRAQWQIRLFPFCTETWEYLVDRCPRCHAVQRWYRTNGIERCDFCVQDLRRAPTSLVPPEHRETARAAVELVHPDHRRRMAALAGLPPEVREIGSDGAISLLVRLLNLVDRRIPYRTPGATAAWPVTPAELTAALAEAWPLLSGWPDAAVAFMSKRIESSRGAYSDGNHNRSVAFFKKASACPNTKAAAAIASLQERLDLNGPLGAAIRERTIDTVSLTKVLGRRASALADIRQKGGLPAVFCLVNGGSAARYERSEIAIIRKAFQQRLSFERAGSLLGISYHGVEQLALMGFLPPIDHPYFAICYGGPQTTLGAFQKLQHPIEAAASPSVQDPVPLRRASMIIGGRLKPWGPIFKSLLEGKVPYALAPEQGQLTRRIMIPARSKPFLEGLSFDKGRFPEFEFADSMTRHDAGETLNLQHKEFTPLLKSYGTPERNGERVIPVGDIERFAAQLIGTAEVALRLNLDPRSAFYLLERLGIGTVAPFLRERAAVERALFDRSP